MAKRITALKCPQCGSVKKQSIKEDHYICNHCDTEYFLDNDDIHVHINHTHKHAERSKNGNSKKKNVAIAIAAAGLAFLLLFSQFLLSPKSGSSARSEDVYTDRPRNQMLYSSADGSTKFFFSVERSYGAYGDKKTEYLLLFYDPTEGRVINEQKAPSQWNDNPTLRYREFADGRMYFIADKINQLYMLDTQSNQLLDVSEKLLATKTEFASGIATLNFVSDTYGDGFQIMTNEGKEYYYFPIADRIYADRKELEKDSEELTTLPSGAVEKKYHIFSEKSSAYPDEPVQLIQYFYKQKAGYPIRLPYGAEWRDVNDYDRDKFSTFKSLFSYHDKRVSRYKDLTPGRTYFKPHIMYQDENRLYIKVLPNANPENVALLQKIDTETGKILWTYKPEAVKAEFSDLSVSKDAVGFYAYNFGSPRVYQFIALNDKDGKPIEQIDLDSFKLK